MFDLRADGSEAELDCRQTGDVQRCKCQPTSSPVPSAQIIQAATCFKEVSSICHDLLTDPYAMDPCIDPVGLFTGRDQCSIRRISPIRHLFAFSNHRHDPFFDGGYRRRAQAKRE